ncbi:ABC transporter substrate-binding protein [Vibrio rhodolitus]|uniref:ABC transporter substrate-binding protein n=1 Tax=Vibrio rhodolitus TaxID=2231649 RepID=UPI000E0B7418|nr:ABC transporter substrate-binding protein [Vibrio rhodolitus]
MKKVLFPCLLSLLGLFASTAHAQTTKTVYMTVWRGCEEACQGFQDYLKTNDLPVELVLRNADRDKSKLDGFLLEAQQMKPDLVVTWGTSVTKALIGSRQDYGSQTKLGEIPALFMIVADPVGAGIIESADVSGRPTVTGIRNRIEEEVQVRAMREYFPVNKIGVLYSPSELNSALNTEKLKQLEDKMEFETVIETYELGDDDKPLADQFDKKMQRLAEQNVDVIYVGSSSYNLSHRDAFTQAALKHNLPVASAYDSMVTESNALISVSNKYYRVGQLAANQAQKVLFANATPGDLPIAELQSYSITINMAVARAMALYPPIQLLRFAELVNVDVSKRAQMGDKQQTKLSQVETR